MKKILFQFFYFFSIQGSAQDIFRLRSIDSLVTAINKANFYTRQDSIIQDYPKLGLSMKTNKSTVGETEEKLELPKLINSAFILLNSF